MEDKHLHKMFRTTTKTFTDRKTGKTTDLGSRTTDMDLDHATNTVRGETPKLPRVPYRLEERAGRGSYKKPVSRKVSRAAFRGGGR